MLLAVVLSVGAGCTGEDPDARDGGGPPESLFAVIDEATQIVEIETRSGKMRRTVVDLRRPDGGFVLIDALELAPDGGALYYSVDTDLPYGSIWRVRLPGGQPERLADGVGPSVSPDGRRLSFVKGPVLHLRDLASGEEQALAQAVGELGGSDTTWSPDGRHVAFASHAADTIGGTDSVDIESGATIDPEPAVPDPSRIYAAYSGRYRPADGMLAVVCCQYPNVADDHPSHGRRLVFHDPGTGAEKVHLDLPFRAGRFAFDATGRHIVFSTWPDGDVYRHDGRRFTRLAGLTGVDAVDW